MNDREATKKRLEQIIEAMDRPLLGLALLTMGLYLLDLHGLVGWDRTFYSALTFVVDLVFVADLALKLYTFGKSYVETPWFMIDLLSCLPVFEVLANGILPLRAIRFVRGFRILRILRGLRMLRALRRIPAFEQLLHEAPETESTRLR